MLTNLLVTPTPRRFEKRFQSSRMDRELRTVHAMIDIYCHDLHGTRDALCAECAELAAYAELRLRKCPFQEAKSTCAKCRIHCYKPEVRDHIREVMRHAGPRMVFRHPLLAVLHKVDGLGKAPEIPRRRSRPQVA